MSVFRVHKAKPSELEADVCSKTKKGYVKFYEKVVGITWDKTKFHVHHLDGNRENNHISNLVLILKGYTICITCML